MHHKQLDNDCFGRLRPMQTTAITRGTSILTMAMITPTTRTTTDMSGWFAAESDTIGLPTFCFRQVWLAYIDCRKQKRAKVRTCVYEQRLLDNIVNTTTQLQQRTWQPKSPILFIVKQPKLREIYAAQFEDRVVHHVLVTMLEPLLDSEFIFDLASNRKNKGTHFAVDRLQHFMRQHRGQGYFLQLDIRNFFNTIHHDILLALLTVKCRKWLKKGKINSQQYRDIMWLSKTVISVNHHNDVILRGNRNMFNRVPPHKRLSLSPKGQGVPIGNLTSQFFANLYLNPLDQYVKHQLGCQHYVRYVDDFILCHHSKARLSEWQSDIKAFIATTLMLSLKSLVVLAPMSQGSDFLGYIVKPGYRLVRRRVVVNFVDKVREMERKMCITKPLGMLINVTPANAMRLSQLYWGHFNQSDSYRLKGRLVARFIVLQLLFEHSCWRERLLPVYCGTAFTSLYGQWHFFMQCYRARLLGQSFVLLMQCGTMMLTNVEQSWGSLRIN